MGIIRTSFEKFDGVVLRVVVVFLLTAIPIGLMLLPSDYFDQGESACISRLLLDTECYGCGITRAVQHMLHGEVRAAIALNPASILVTPLGIVLWFKYCILNVKALRIYFRSKESSAQ
jgi:hypothetical protein